MPKPIVNIPKGLRRKKDEADGPAARKSVQLSNTLMGALDERAAQELLPLAAVVRRAVAQLLAAVSETGAIPQLDLDEEEAAIRTGRRGPATQWPDRVSYVLPRDQAKQLAEVAAKVGVSEARFVRTALHLALHEPIADVRPLRRTKAGFITSSPPRGSAARTRQTVDLYDRLRNNS